MKNETINNDRVIQYRVVAAKLAVIDPASQDFEDLQKESENIWSTLTPEEKAVAHEEHTTNI